MKLIIENFRKFLAEQNFISGIPLEQDEEGNIIASLQVRFIEKEIIENESSK